MTLMFSGMLEVSVVDHALTIPQDTAIISIFTAGTLIADTGDVAYAGRIVSWQQQYTTHLAKYPKVKSTLPYQHGVPPMALPASTRLPHADVPLQVFADTYCYAIHPRPPTPLTA